MLIYKFIAEYPVLYFRVNLPHVVDILNLIPVERLVKNRKKFFVRNVHWFPTF